jgi:hypothetical protein
MATVKVPGLDKSKGMSGGDFVPYVEGEYGMECVSVKIEDKESDKGTGQSWEFKFTILEGPDQADGKAADGRKFTRFIYLMNDDHQSFEEWGHIGVDELESLRIACGVDKKGSSIDPQAFVGEKCRAVLRVKEETKGPYAGKKRNEVREWRAYK